MPLVPAKCTNCGANIEIDNAKEAGICSHCGTAFVTQKAINNYVNDYHITQNITKHIYGKEKSECEDFLRNGEVFLKLKEWKKARNCFNSAMECNPSNYLAWLGLAKCETRNWTLIQETDYQEYMKKAKTVANEKEKEEMENIELNYLEKFCCPLCDNDEFDENHVCTNCEYKLTITPLVECPACFHEVKDDECTYCGYNIVTKLLPNGDYFDPDNK
jgi:DNA-directed RNA polymerase subunit RPC12/RpoP